MVLLAIWLIATSALPLLQISFGHSAILLNVLALAAGILLLLGR
jgi:hypothetical protein